MPDYVLVGKGIRIDPKRIKKDLSDLQQEVNEQIAEAIRLEISIFLRQLRKAHSRRLTQLKKYTDTNSLIADNPFSGAQARKRRNGGNWIIYVTRGSQDQTRGLTGGLFELLDKGREQITLEQNLAIPVFRPKSRLKRSSLSPGSPVVLKTRRLKSGKVVPVYARTRVLSGFKGYKFYERATANVKRKLIGTKVVKGELQYTITKSDFDTNFEFREIEVD